MSLEDIQLDIIVTLQGSQNIKAAATALSSVTNAANKVRSSADAIQSVNIRSIKSWNDLRDQLSAVEQKYDAVYRAGMHLTMMGQTLVGWAEKIIGTGKEIVDTYEDYDLMLRRGSTALNTNAKWQGKLDQAIQNTAISIGLFSPTEVAEGYYIWGAASGQVVDSQKELNDITRVVADTMLATAAAGGTLEGNLNGVYGVLAQFNLPVSKAADVVHTLALMTERTAAQFPDLINSFTYIGPLAESLGIKFGDVVSILGVLADAGQKGSRAGRGLSMVLEGMSAPSDKARDALDGVVQKTHGLNSAWEKIVFPQGKFIGLRKMVMELADGLEDATDAERGRFYATAFTNNATRALIPLIEDQIDLNEKAARTGQKVTSVLDKQKYSLDGTADFWQQLTDKISHSILGIRTRLENSFFPIIQTMAKTIVEDSMPVIQTISKIAVAFGKWLQHNPELVKMAVRIAGVVAAVLAGAGVIFLFAGAVTTLLANLGNLVLGIGRVLGPFGILIGLLVGLGVAVWNNVGGIRDALGHLMGSIGHFFAVLTGNGETFKSFWSDMWGLVKKVTEIAATVLAKAFEAIADGLDAISQNETAMGIIRTAVGVLVRFRGAIAAVAVTSATLWAAGRALSFFTGAVKILSGYNTIISILKGMATAFSLIRAALAAGGIATAIEAVAAAIGGPLAASIGAVVVAAAPIIGVVLAIGAVIALLYLAWTNNWGGIRDITANVVKWLGDTFGGLVNFIGQVVGNIVGFFQNMVGFIVGIPGAVANMVNSVIQWFGQLPGRIGEFIASVGKTIWDGLSYIANHWTYWLGFIIGFVIGWIARMLFNAGKFAAELVGRIVGWIMKLPGRVANFFGQVATNVVRWFATNIPRFAGRAADLVTGIVHWVSTLPGRVFNFFVDLAGKVVNWFGTNIPRFANLAWKMVTDIVDFFIRLPGRVMDAVSYLVPRMIGFLRGMPGKIWSALLNIGGQIVKGIWQGITNLWGWFSDQVGNFFGGIVDGVKSGLGIQSPSKVFAEIGSQMIAGVAVGINANSAALGALANYTDRLVGMAQGTSLAFSGAAIDGLSGMGDLSVTSDARRVLRLELDLTSSDGSQDGATLEKLKATLTNSDLIRALEHMVTVK